MNDCIFCKIIKGEVPSYTIYENDNIKVFMDISPIAKGHSLVIPKKHYTDLMDIDTEILREMDEVIKELYPKFKEKLGAEGLTRMQNNGLGQDVKHYHMHLIPRYSNANYKITIDEEAKNKIAETFELLK
jgi:histidine triad (HIT) family protein